MYQADSSTEYDTMQGKQRGYAFFVAWRGRNARGGEISVVILFKNHPPILYKSTKLKKFAPDVLTLRPGLDNI